MFLASFLQFSSGCQNLILGRFVAVLFFLFLAGYDRDRCTKNPAYLLAEKNIPQVKLLIILADPAFQIRPIWGLGHGPGALGQGPGPRSWAIALGHARGL